ncbi:Bug family tripartite tricarboxylate transporter substrate binding protein [Variovorax sp. M-6]|uniref:Bug family tripartite tricarboxylate transporter substrate binding protein n=1 Tax=Variovorax sp. M-6 TaxID=3233041 RepID=UPI003F9B36E9
MTRTQPIPDRRRRSLLPIALRWTAAACCAAVLGTTSAMAQTAAYPNRPVRIVLPFPPGTANDITLRMIAERLSKRWNQPVIIDNKPGASSIIGTDFVAKAPPDGYTLLANITLIVQNPALRKKLPYDATKDLVPVTQLNRQQLAVFTRSDLPVKSVAELLSYAKANPDKVNFATWGLGSTAHLMLEKIRVDKGAQMTHVPYKGGAEINKAVISGEADVGVADLLSPDAHFKSGRLRVIGVTGPSRIPTMPEVQTLAEAGVQGFEGYNWLGLFAPAQTPPQIVRKISDDINEIQADPALARRFTDEMFVSPSATTPEEFAKIFNRDLGTWTSVIQRVGVSLE